MVIPGNGNDYNVLTEPIPEVLTAFIVINICVIYYPVRFNIPMMCKLQTLKNGLINILFDIFLFLHGLIDNKQAVTRQ